MTLERKDALRDRLIEIDESREKLDGKGAILTGPRGYVSGLPYLLSSDINRAFVFKNKAEAAQVRADFLDILEQFTALELA